MPAMLAAALVAVIVGVLPVCARADELGALLSGIRWGEGAAALARQWSRRAVRLDPPIEFGDSIVDVALKDFRLGGYRFTVYFQMDKTTRGLKRVMLERQRHGANPMVYRAVLAALRRDYGAPSVACTAPARRSNGYQAAVERIWQPAGITIRAIFRDTTMEAAEGCVRAAIGPCGLAGHLYVQIVPRGAGEPTCG